MMQDQLEAQYQEWLKGWELANPQPSLPPKDQLLNVLQIGVVIGSIVLSGTRTGNVVADIGTFADFGSKIAYLGLGRGAFIAAEAILAFVTFDVGVLLAGYLTGEETEDSKWYYALLVASLIPALVANMFPAIRLLGPGPAETAQAITNTVVGIATPIMSFVAGRVLGVVRTRGTNELKVLMREWETKRNNAWKRHFNKYVKSTVRVRVPVPREAVVSSDNGALGRKVVVALESGPLSLQALADAVSLSRADVIPVVSDLSQKGRVEFDGNKVSVLDF
jgi:hypothetical protein